MKNPFQKLTVASVMAGFNKTLADLEAVRQASLDEFNHQATVIANAYEAKEAAAKEAESAAAIAQRINALINGDTQ